ncbi:MAG: hypothetical protein WKF97_10780 [Chitinophagaceae bacterium]
MPNKDKKKSTGKGGSKSVVPAKSAKPKHEDAPQRITEHKEIGIGMPVSNEEMNALKEKARKLDR